MKIKEEILGKEVIDESGATIGIIKDLELDVNSKEVETLEIEEPNLTSKLGLGEKKLLPFKLVQNIGDKVLIKGNF